MTNALKYTWALVLAFGFLEASAQSGVIVTGGDATGTGGSMSYTVGQIDFMHQEGAGGSTNQGLQQPYEFFNVGMDEVADISIEAQAFPNPTLDGITLKLQSASLDGIYIQLFDINGKILFHQKVTSTETYIPMSDMPSAVYFLKVQQGNSSLKTIKISKNI